METIIQLTYNGKEYLNPYEVIATLPFLYECPKNTALTIKGKQCIVDEIRDIIDEDGNIKRLYRVFYAH